MENTADIKVIKQKVKTTRKWKNKDTKETLKDTPLIIPLKEFNIFGCPLSTDIDVACLVDSKETVELIRQNKLALDNDGLLKELILLGYDVKFRAVDANPIYLEDKNLQIVLKGSKETQNIILSTYKHHKQKYPCFFETKVELDIVEKMRSVAKFILDNLELFLGKDQYLKERPNKKLYYAGGWTRVKYSIDISKKIKFIDTDDFKDFIKSLTMKIIQFILLNKEDEEYTKLGLVEKFAVDFPEKKNNILWLLTRGKMGSTENIQECINLLLSQYEKTAFENKDNYEWKRFDLDLNINPTLYTDELLKEFLKSPLEPTERFIEQYQKLCDNNFRIGEFCPIKCLNTDLIPKNILNKCILVDQRSKEWQELLLYYKCGKNTGIVDCKEGNFVKTYYNLIRGAIIELMIIHSVDFSSILKIDIKKIIVGLIVEEMSKGSTGIAPDLLLLEDKTLIPVEIKCLHNKFNDDHDFRRGIKLAKSQLKTTLDIIGGKKGIIAIMNISKENEKIIYEGRMSFINYK